MADTFSKEQRSDIMRKVKSSNTKPELLLRSRLHRLGFRFRINQKKLPGTPDIVLPKYHTVINVHGCFWHGHENCKRSTLPETNKPYWANKIQRNKSRDETNKCKLIDAGWRVINVFECELNSKKIQETLSNIVNTITSV